MNVGHVTNAAMAETLHIKGLLNVNRDGNTQKRIHNLKQTCPFDNNYL